MVDAAGVRSPLSDQQLRDAVRSIALRYLAVERGHRRIDVLRPVLSWRALDAEFAKPKHREPRAAGQRPPGTADIGGVWLERRGEHADAAVLVRDGDGRWGALLLKIRCDGMGRYKVDELARAEERDLAPSSGGAARRAAAGVPGPGGGRPARPAARQRRGSPAVGGRLR